VIAHIVLFRPRASLAPADREALLASFTTAVQEIAALRRARVGQRVRTGRPYERASREDYTHVAILEFDDEAGLQAYLTAPAHEELARRFFAGVETALVYDFDLDGN
jgi:hypothetical protein